MVYRALFLLCNLIAAGMALCSPLVLIQWLVNATGIQLVVDAFQWVSPVAAPANQLIMQTIPNLPTMLFNNQPVPTTQAMSGLVYGLGFFAFTWLGQQVKQTQRRLESVKNKRKAQDAQKQAEASFNQVQKKIMNYKEILVHIKFPFRQFPQIGQLFSQYEQYEGYAIPADVNSAMVGFKDVQMAIAFVIQVSNTLVSYYKNLTPTDPKPPFKCGIHVIWEEDDSEQGLKISQSLSEFAPENATVFSGALKKILDAKGLTSHYRMASTGLYKLANQSDIEVFALDPVLPDY
jgi:hypothetical protein